MRDAQTSRGEPMCVFFPLIILLGAAPWLLEVSNAARLGFDAVLLLLLAWLARGFLTPVRAVGGIPVEELAGRPCPVCGSTETVPWTQGRRPVGLRCTSCDRRSGPADLNSRTDDGARGARP